MQTIDAIKSAANELIYFLAYEDNRGDLKPYAVFEESIPSNQRIRLRELIHKLKYLTNIDQHGKQASNNNRHYKTGTPSH